MNNQMKNNREDLLEKLYEKVNIVLDDNKKLKEHLRLTKQQYEI